MSDPGELTPAEARDQAACDAAAVVLMQAIQRRGLFDEIRAAMTAEEWADYLAGEERHAARMRALGRPGW
jgi:hypothetical protein